MSRGPDKISDKRGVSKVYKLQWMTLHPLRHRNQMSGPRSLGGSDTNLNHKALRTESILTVS